MNGRVFFLSFSSSLYYELINDKLMYRCCSYECYELSLNPNVTNLEM